MPDPYAPCADDPQTTTYHYRVQYVRQGWKKQSPAVRFFRRREAADRLMARLLAPTPTSPGKRALAPVTYLRLDRCPVGDWSHVVTVRGDA